MNTNPTFVVTGKARLSFVHLTQPYSNNPQQEAKYSTTVLIPKSDVATKQRIDAAIEAATQKGAQDKWKGRPPVVATPIHDGDGVRPSDGMPFGPECKGCWVFTASSKSAPEVVDTAMNPIIDSTQIYSGMYARVSLNFFPYAVQGKKGIGCGLGNVQKLEDGEVLGGSRTSAVADFGTPDTGYGMPTPQYQAPVQPQYQPPTPPQYQPQVYQAPAYQPQAQPVYPGYPAPDTYNPNA